MRVGYSHTDLGYEAFRWTSDGGMAGLGDLPGGIFESYPYGISDDGLTIVGYGINPDGFHEAWIATVPEPSTLILFALGGLILRKRK